MNNPYPELIDDGTGWMVQNERRPVWQEGWDAREVVTKELYEALKDIKQYVVRLDAMGPETRQVIAGKCFLALAKAEKKQ